MGLFFSIENKTGQALEGGLLGVYYESWVVLSKIHSKPKRFFWEKRLAILGRYLIVGKGFRCFLRILAGQAILLFCVLNPYD